MPRMLPPSARICLPLLALMACSPGPAQTDSRQEGAPSPSTQKPFTVEKIATFDEPWAMTFVGNGPWALITQRGGKLLAFDMRERRAFEVSGVPRVDYGGQGGLGDIIMAPDPDPTDKIHPVYLSWVEAGQGDTRGAVVAQADLTINTMADAAFALANLRVIWRQQPKVGGSGHFSHRLTLSPDRQYLFIASGDRQKFDPAQDMTGNLGKIVRLAPDGAPARDNPFADKGGTTAQIWSLGHRNILGITFDSAGRLWEAEMGPKGGDEVNLVARGANYGWPRASNGSHYDGRAIPDHKAGDGFEAPAAWWTPSISPSSLAYYNAALFPAWKDSLFVGALSGEALIRLKIEGDRLVKADHWAMGMRIREVETGPDGALWLLADGKNAPLLRLTPASPSSVPAR